jgi:hypothetical protein
MKKFILSLVAIFLIIFIGIQFVPYGRDHSNPAVINEPNWDSPTTRDLAQRACFDCHSNETVWPWYSHVAPVSWLVYRDVVNGRRHLNFSEWGQRRVETGELREVIQEGEMPLPIYLIMHADARLTNAEKTQLIDGLKNSTQ